MQRVFGDRKISLWDLYITALAAQTGRILYNKNLLMQDWIVRLELKLFSLDEWTMWPTLWH